MNTQPPSSANTGKQGTSPGLHPNREQRTEVEQKAEEVAPFYVTFGIYLTLGIVVLAAAIWFLSL